LRRVIEGSKKKRTSSKRFLGLSEELCAAGGGSLARVFRVVFASVGLFCVRIGVCSALVAAIGLY
jgi:hypothetical protein